MMGEGEERQLAVAGDGGKIGALSFSVRFTPVLRRRATSKYQNFHR